MDTDSLDEPLELPFEVRTSRSMWLLIVVAAMGLLVGAAARFWLRSRIAKQEANIQAGELLQSIDRYLERYQDQTFHQVMGPKRTELEADMARLPADRLSTRAASISADLTSSLADLDTRRQEELKDVLSLSAILRRARGQPRFASDALDLTLAGLDQATTQAMSGNVSAASSTREKAIADLVHTLRVSSDALEAGLQPILAVLKDGSLHLAAEAAPQAQQRRPTSRRRSTTRRCPTTTPPPRRSSTPPCRLRKSTTEITIAIIPSLHSLARETLDILSATPSTELGPAAALQRAAEALIK